LLATARWLFGAGPALDYPLAHLVNFALFLLVLGGAEWLRRELRDGDGPVDDASSLLCIMGAGWAALRLVGLQVISPDMGVLACALGAAAAMVRIRRKTTRASAATLGIVLGIGYLMKAVMFPIALAYLIVAAVMPPSDSRRWRLAALAGVVFSAVALPQFMAVSRLVGRPTFGQSGMLNQAWHIGRVPAPLSEDHARPMSIRPDSGISLVADTSTVPTPRLFFIDGRAPGTFPLWSDITRWYPGSISFHRDRDRQIRKIVRGVRIEVSPILKFVLVPLIAWLLVGRPRWFGRGTTDGWMLVALGAAPLGLYALVSVEFRLIAPFVLLVILGLSRVLVRPAPLGLLAGVALVAIGSALANDVRSLPTLAPKRAQWAQLASVLRDSTGRQPRLVALGDAWEAPMYARLARARMIAIMDAGDAARWWRSSPAERALVEAQLDSIPNAFVVARAPAGPGGTPAGWSAVAGSEGYILRRTGSRSGIEGTLRVSR
jgi:hypothetical protein